MKYLFASDIHGSAYYCRKLLDAFRESRQNVWFFWAICSIMAREMIFQENMHPKKSLLFSMNIKTKFTLSAETVRPRLTRWFWNFR